MAPSLDALLDEAERRPMVGWDLRLDGRIVSTHPWDFEAIADAEIAAAPNVPVAAARLSPLGVSVLAVEGAPDNADQAASPSLPALPFADGAFRLVTNRHESFVATEIARVLASGGRFITQQVASDFSAPMRALLGAPDPSPPPEWSLSVALAQVCAAGLEVARAEAGDALVTFADVGALAWYLRHVPWVLPGFEIAAFRPRLEALHGAGPIRVPQPHFWLLARRAGTQLNASISSD